MLLDSIRSLFGGAAPASAKQAASPTTPPDVDPLHLAACALLLEIAYADGEFTAAERSHLESVLERHFALPAESGRRLLELAEQERRNSVDHFRFTSQLQQGYDLG